MSAQHYFEQLIDQTQARDLILAAGLKIASWQLETRDVTMYPAFIRVGRAVRYERSEVERWINQQLSQLE